MITYRRGEARGQTLVEFALVIPIFLSLLMGIADLGRVVWAYNSVASAAREGARFAIVHGGSMNNLCPVGPMDLGQMNADASPETCGFPISPSTDAIKAVARGAAIAGGTNPIVSVCYGTDCSGDLTTGTNARGTPVTVSVSSTIPLTVPAFFGISGYTVTGSTTMLVNH